MSVATEEVDWSNVLHSQITAAGADHPWPVFAVTVTYNSADVLDDFLASVAVQDGLWSLIIVDNASTDGTRARLAEIDDPRIQVILNDTNGGFAAGTNIGIKAALQAGAGSILLLNNDTVFGPGLFDDLASHLFESGADALSPVIVFDHDPNSIWYAGGHLDRRKGLKVVHEHFESAVDRVGRTTFETSFCPACCMIFTRSSITRTGLLDEDFFVYWEDVDYCLRIADAGLVIMVAPELRIRHKASVLTGGMLSDFSMFQQYQNQIIVLRKNAGPLMLAYGLAAICAQVVSRVVRRWETTQGAVKRFQAIWTGLRKPLTDAPKPNAKWSELLDA